MQTVFIGTSEFATAVLRRLAASPHSPALVITRPDRPRGRGRHLSPPPVALVARELGLEVEQPENVNDREPRRRIAAARPQAVCVCAYGALIKEPLLSDHWVLNVHPSLLPRWRGAAPIERAIMAGDELTGVSIMRVTAGLDSGPVCSQQSESICVDDDYGRLASRLRLLGGELLVQALDRRQDCAAQDDARATYAEKITPQDRKLDPARPAAELERVVRALHPHIGAWIELQDGTRLGVSGARAIPDGGEPGRLLTEGESAPAVQCADGALALLAVKPAGRREMSGADWLRGRHR